MKILIISLVITIPALGNILFVYIIYLFLYSIFEVNIFGSSINTYCLGGLHLLKNECNKLDNEWVYNHENFQNFWCDLKSNFE